MYQYTIFDIKYKERLGNYLYAIQIIIFSNNIQNKGNRLK